MILRPPRSTLTYTPFPYTTLFRTNYEARQEFSLGEQVLHATLCCRNVSDRPMPCGLGFHPYFPCSTGTLLQTAVSHVWTIDENVLPVERVAATGRYALDGGTVCGRGLDNGYDGWSGLALISQPDAPFDLCMSSPDASYFQLYSPEERSEEHTSELQSLMRISYAVFCLKKKKHKQNNKNTDLT